MSETSPTSSPWTELAEWANRLPVTNRDRVLERDRAVRAAVMHDAPVRELADQLGMSVQAVYQAVERAEQDERVSSARGYQQTVAALERMTDAVAFERLVSVLLAEFVPDLRPTQPQGDRRRDAVAGVRRLDAGEELIVTISLRADWAKKVQQDLRRLAELGAAPRAVYAVTSREASVRRVEELQQTAADLGWSLSVFDGRWLTTQLSRPEHLDLRAEFLGLPHPTPHLFLTPTEFEALLRQTPVQQPSRFVGRQDQATQLMRLLGDENSVILEAPGGRGKSRFLIEAARGNDSAAWWFVRDGLPFERDMLAELGAGNAAVVVIDDAHRRADLRAVLAALERRTPRPAVVLVTRPGFAERLEEALEGVALGRPVRLELPPLSRAEIAALLEGSPFAVRYGGLRTAIVYLAEGSPQIAAIAGELASRGLALHELTRDELMRSYVAAVLRSAVGDSRESLAVVALVSAVGSLRLDQESLAVAGELLGMAVPHLRRELAELADLGILQEDGDAVAIKPDLLAERILVGCFFDRSWRPALDYHNIYARFSPRDRHGMLSVLGQSLRWVPDRHRDSPGLLAARADVLEWCRTAASVDALVRAADLAGALAPGAPSIAAEAADLLISRLPGEFHDMDRVVSALLHLLAQIGSFTDSWPRLLALAERVFAAPASERARKEVADAITGVHERLPVDQWDKDTWTLAAVQQAMVELTEEYWRRERRSPGAASAVAVAARALLKVIFEVHRMDAANPDQIHLLTVALPATDFTERCLRTGARLLLETLPELPTSVQRDQIQALHALAHPALGFAGPFGVQLSKETRNVVNRVFDDILEPWFAEHIDELALPIAGEALDLFEWRTAFGRPPAAVPQRTELRDYRTLVQPSAPWKRGVSIEVRRRHDQETATALAEQLRSSDDPLAVLDRWGAWVRERAEMTGDRRWRPILPMALESAAAADLTAGEEMIDHLLAIDSPLLAYASAAMSAVLSAECHEQTALRWAAAPSSTARQALVWTLPLLDEGLQRTVFERLAAAPEQEVRAAVGRALRFQPGVMDWRARVALRLSAADADLQLLAEVLRVLTEDSAETELPRLEADERELVRTALMQETHKDAREAYELVESIRAARRLGIDLLWEWIWARVDRLRHRELGDGLSLTLGLPEEVLALVSERADEPESDANLRRALDELEMDNDEWLAHLALIELIAALDRGSTIVSERLAQWAGDQPRAHRLVHEMMNSPVPWEVFTARAAAILAVSPETDMLQLIVHSREPTSFMGSRIPYYQTVKEQFASWGDHLDGNLVRAALIAEEYFDARIAEAREYERQRLDSY